MEFEFECSLVLFDVLILIGVVLLFGLKIRGSTFEGDLMVIDFILVRFLA